MSNNISYGDQTLSNVGKLINSNTRTVKSMQVLGPSSTSTSSRTFINMPNTPSVSVIKTTGSDLMVTIRASIYRDTGFPTSVTLGAYVDVVNTSYDVAILDYFTYLEAMVVSGFTRITGLAAGTYTITAQWKAPLGTVAQDSNGFTFLKVEEI